MLRFALVGVGWPDDRGSALPLVAGRALGQSHGELIADASLGLPVGATLSLADDEYRVVGLTRQFLASSGDAVLVATRSDAQLIVENLPPDAIRTERERRVARLRDTDLGRAQPLLEDIAVDPRWRPPALPSSAIAAVLVDVDGEARIEEVRRTIAAWPDVSVYTTGEQERLLLDGVVEKPRKQLGLFSLILVVTSSVLISAAIYMMTLQKTHDIAVLKLMGAPRTRIAAMVLEQAWLIGAVGYGLAVAIGSQAFPHFPRRVVLTTPSIAAVALLVLVVSTLASLLGVAYALKVDAGRALEA
jgi:putative ABC transport system permease protein